MTTEFPKMFTGLSNEQMMKQAPSIFSTEPAPDVSDRYVYLPSYEIIDELKKIDLVPFTVREGKVRAHGRAYALHEIKSRQRTHYSRAPELGELSPEISFLNSHNRTSGAIVEVALERAVCTNGMRVCDSKLDLGFRVRHSGKGRYDELVAGIKRMVEGVDKVIDVANDWEKIMLSRSQVLGFAQKAMQIKGTTLDLDVDALLTARRHADQGNTLWRVFNRLQENFTKGGIAGRTQSGRRASLKRISTLAADVEFNRKLWTAASELAAEVKPVSISVSGPLA